MRGGENLPSVSFKHVRRRGVVDTESRLDEGRGLIRGHNAIYDPGIHESPAAAAAS